MGFRKTIRGMFLTKNVGVFDRMLRAIPLPCIALLHHQGAIEGVFAIVLWMVSAMLLLTSILGSCSVYYFLGFSTCPVSGKSKSP